MDLTSPVDEKSAVSGTDYSLDKTNQPKNKKTAIVQNEISREYYPFFFAILKYECDYIHQCKFDFV